MKLQYNNYSVFSIFEWVTVQLIIFLFFFVNIYLFSTIDFSVFSFRDLIDVIEEIAIDPFVESCTQKYSYLLLYIIGALFFFRYITKKKFKIKNKFYVIDSFLIIGYIAIYLLLILLPIDILHFYEYRILYVLLFLIVLHLLETTVIILVDYIKNPFILLTLFISLILLILV